MGLLQKLLKGSEDKKEFNQKLKQAQQEDRIQMTIEERKKSANERELERYMSEQREERIKKSLEKIHTKSNKDNWKSPNSILGQKSTMLNNERPILKERNIFHGNKNMFTKEHARKHKTDMGFFK